MSGGLVDVDGFTVSIVGTASVDATGEVSASISVNDCVSHFTGTLASGKALIVATGTDCNGFRELAVLMKGGGSFSTADLDGTWYFHAFSDWPISNDPRWTRGTTTFDPGGVIISGNSFDSDGISGSITGTASVDSAGIVTASVTSNGCAGGFRGKLSVEKMVITGTQTDCNGYRVLAMLVKEGGLFSTADLAGVWHLASFWDSPLGNDPGWTRGTLTLDTTGQITTASATNSDDESGSISGSAAVSADGAISASIAVGACATAFAGKLDTSKTTAVGTTTDCRGYRGLSILIKSN
jgi:hypothetical protein